MQTSAKAKLSRGGVIHGEVHIVSWFDFETCFKVMEDGAIGQNTYDFLLVFYSNFGRISYRFCATVDLCRNDLAGRLWPLNDSEGQSWSPTLRLGQDVVLVKISCKSMDNFLREAAHRQIGWPTWSYNLRSGGRENEQNALMKVDKYMHQINK